VDYITATGGTITCCGDYKIHTFTSDGTFCVSAGPGLKAVVDYLVVAGGGGGGGALEVQVVEVQVVLERADLIILCTSG
jgi:hypothetical protein